MYIRIYVSLIITFCFYLCSAQSVLTKKWDKRYGGNYSEGLYKVLQKGNGYLLTGGTDSDISGDVSQPNINEAESYNDYWVIMVDSVGNKLWDKRYGGTLHDDFSIAYPTIDNGFIIGGSSFSNAGGDKTENSKGGDFDYWLVKVDSVGNKQWDKTFGGNYSDEFADVKQTLDGGYIVGGSSNSGMAFDKSQLNWSAAYDFWVVKMDANGHKLWDKRYGGSVNERLTGIEVTPDGGYLLAGSSSSGIDGNRTQFKRAETNWDYWVIKIDSIGEVQWDRAYGITGGTKIHSFKAAGDGGYVLGGYASEGSNNEKTDSVEGYWIVKIDSAGNKEWDHTFTGISFEWFTTETTSLTYDKGFLISTISDMNAGGDKSEDNLGPSQGWIIKIDSLGRKQWDKTILTNGDDNSTAYALETNDGCYLFANYTFAGIGGYKTQVNLNASNDFWVVKFCFEPTGINEPVKDNVRVNVSPNPFTSDISINLQKENLKEATFTITNLLGQPVYTRHEDGLSHTYTKMLDLSFLPNGIYILEVTAGDSRIVKQMVKQ